MGLLQLLSFFRLRAKRKASSCQRLPAAEEQRQDSRGKRFRRRSLMDRLGWENKRGWRNPNRRDSNTRSEEQAKIINTFNAIQVHKFAKKSSSSRLSPIEFLTSLRGGAESSEPVKECEEACCPSPRSGHRIFATEDYIYMVGGYKPNQTPDVTFQDVWRFNILSEKWQRCKLVGDFMPTCLASFSLVQTGLSNEVYVFGGTGVPFGNAASDSLYKLRVSEKGEVRLQKQLIEGNQMHKPPRIYGQAMCFAKSVDKNKNSVSKIYLMGGTSGHEYNIDVWKLQTEDSRESEECAGTPLGWSNSEFQKWKSALLTARVMEQEHGRYRLEVVLHENMLITFGGGAPGFVASFEELLTFDLTTERFLHLRTHSDPEHGYPEPRKCHSLVQYEENVYIIGGCSDMLDGRLIRGQTPMKMTNDTWKLDLSTMSWTKMKANLPTALFFHSAAVTSEGCIYVFGGCTDTKSTSRTNQIFRMWLKPPTLRHLAMKALYNNMGSIEEVVLSNPIRLIRELSA